MANFFIRRPIFAWVLAIILMMAGALAILQLPVAQYPTIAPPAVSVSANYPGADAQTVQEIDDMQAKIVIYLRIIIQFIKFNYLCTMCFINLAMVLMTVNFI